MDEQLCVVVVVWAADRRGEASAPLPLIQAVRLVEQLRRAWEPDAYVWAGVVPLDSLGRLPV